ncbi:hypothetical protein ABE67_23055 [Cytobacillus firmus]|uniref:hypothetical protein n=1 Tax=Cytobacillus firmus TaxID=1399 RepID=UPI0018CF23F9|nr:hypothetical protein [Cytobacillus firmus]MBG9452156.1 hypothetical protein [Cytobacillus firmus]
MDQEEIHTIEIEKDGTWERIHYKSLANGHKFRMFYPDGNKFIDSDRSHIFQAASEPFYDDELGTWFITIK